MQIPCRFTAADQSQAAVKVFAEAGEVGWLASHAAAAAAAADLTEEADREGGGGRV